MSVLNINKNNLNLIKSSKKPVLLDFYAEWCGPCRTIAHIIEEIAEERNDILVAKINIDNEPEIASEFNVRSIPSLFVIKDGKITNRATGGKPKRQILAMLEN